MRVSDDNCIFIFWVLSHLIPLSALHQLFDDTG